MSIPFNLNEFKSRVIAPQRSNRFEVIINRQGGESEDFSNIRLLAEDVQFPQFEFSGMYSVPRYGFGLQDVFPAGPKHKELIVTFIMEQGGGAYDAFVRWIQDITPINFSPSEGSDSDKYYTLSYKDNYEAYINIMLLGEAEDSLPGIWHFNRAWPVSIMGEPLSWEVKDQYVSFAVTFVYYQMAFTPGERPVEGDLADRYRNVVVNADPGTHAEIDNVMSTQSDPDLGISPTLVQRRRIVSNRRVGPG